jgi:hypothetical protein
MPPTRTDQIGEIVNRVRDWPPEDRLSLVQQILHTLQRDLRAPPSGGKSLKGLLGLLQTGGQPPSDEDCERILEEELRRKYVP